MGRLVQPADFRPGPLTQVVLIGGLGYTFPLHPFPEDQRVMRFEFYHPGLEDVPKLSVDGTVGNAIHFSHWVGNETPAELKADTSTEIALNLVAAPHRQRLTQGIDLVTNNHFDTDGVLSVWTVLTGEHALDLNHELTAAAEAGDFSEFSSEAGVRASIVIQGAEQASPTNESGSPLARKLAGEEVDEARAYELVLPEVERVLTHIDDYEQLWREAWDRIATALDSFARGTSSVIELTAARLSVISLAPEIFSPSGFSPTRHAAPYTAISKYARGEMFLIATPIEKGWAYRIDYPYYSWAETIVRPQIKRRDLTAALTELNGAEGNRDGKWQPNSSELTSAAKFLGADGALACSQLPPERVAEILAAE